MMFSKGFASDNWSGVHPEVMQALHHANTQHNPAYGELDDPVLAGVKKKFNEAFGKEVAVFFVYNGTAANVLAIQQLLRSYEAVVTAHSAHIHEDEAGAPEKISGSKLLLLETHDGKIKTHQVEPFLNSIGFQHHVQPRMISISQVTEMGTVYDVGEISRLADFAHQNNMYLHVDGARIANAAVSLNKSFKELISDTKVDVLSFGGTKNGLMFGEAVVFLNPEMALNFEYVRKQSMQLHSKMRFIAAQFHAYLSNNLWKRNALHANQMAQILANQLESIGIALSRKVEANAVFAQLPQQLIPEMQQHYFFHVWNPNISEVRLMCSFDTQESEIFDFIRLLKQKMS